MSCGMSSSISENGTVPAIFRYARPGKPEKTAAKLWALYRARDRSQQVLEAGKAGIRMKEAHMKAKSKLMLLGVSVAFALLTSCVRPQQAIDDAKAAVEAAGKEGASIYSADAWARVNRDLARVLAVVDAQEKKPVKDYRGCEDELDRVCADAKALSACLPELKERAKSRATEAESEAEVAIEEAKALLRRVPRSERTQPLIDSCRTKLPALEDALVDAQEAIANGDYFGSLDISNPIRDDAMDCSDDLRIVIRMSRRNRQSS